MATSNGLALLFRMMRRIVESGGIGRRARLSCRQIGLAVALTLAAIVLAWTTVQTRGPAKLEEPVATGDDVRRH